jgi:hypothetical protein
MKYIVQRNLEYLNIRYVKHIKWGFVDDYVNFAVSARVVFSCFQDKVRLTLSHALHCNSCSKNRFYKQC